MDPSARDALLLDTARAHLPGLASVIAAADPEGRVTPRSQVLCAGLAVLARSGYAALGGTRHAHAVGDAAAMLSLLTKIDDQVIDALEFHGGPLAARDPRELDRRTRAYLGPTLASLRSGAPATDEPRCALAADLGRRLHALARATPERLDHLIATVAFGWEVQVRAVRVLSSDPTRVELAAVEAVTADISGAWLLMVTMIGELPEDARRPLSPSEEAAFYAWGRSIQAADAFADLGKDTADGLVASLPGVLLAREHPSAWRAAFESGALAPLARGLVEAGIDRALLPDPASLAARERALAGLGEVGPWLAWIHGFLRYRWLVDPVRPRLAEPTPDDPSDEAGRAWARGWQRWLSAVAHEPTPEPQEPRCSAP